MATVSSIIKERVMGMEPKQFEDFRKYCEQMILPLLSELPQQARNEIRIYLRSALNFNELHKTIDAIHSNYTKLGIPTFSRLQEMYHDTEDQHQNESNVDKKLLELSKKEFSKKSLIVEIHTELSKTHLQDDAEKLTLFLTSCTGYLAPSLLHKSLAAKGGTSVGKDNMVKTVLKHFPEEDWIYLTNATESTIEDDIGNYKIIAISELNLFSNDRGANVHLLEKIKQLTEGGTSSLKKDVMTGYKTTKHSQQDQKTILYNTAETQSDEQLSTRLNVIGVEASSGKINAVNKNTFDVFAGVVNSAETSWISLGIKHLLKNNTVVIPYALMFKEIKIFDTTDARAMRDTKRFLALVAAVAWLYQLQREKDSKGRIVSIPFDFLVTLIIAGQFFNYTYSGTADKRILNYIECMNEICDKYDGIGNEKEVFARHHLQEKMGVSINTVKDLSKGCQDLSVIRFHHKDNTGVYYLRCQRGVKRVLLGVNYKDMIDVFDKNGGVKLDNSTVGMLDFINNLINLNENRKKDSTLEEIDTQKVDTPNEKDEVEEIHVGEKS